jgi:hypothetical protein
MMSLRKKQISAGSEPVAESKVAKAPEGGELVELRTILCGYGFSYQNETYTMVSKDYQYCEVRRTRTGQMVYLHPKTNVTAQQLSVVSTA